MDSHNLPKPKTSIATIFNIVAAIITISSFIQMNFGLPIPLTSPEIIFAIFLISLLSISIIYIIYFHLKKSHRYIESGMYFSHIANTLQGNLAKFHCDIDNNTVNMENIDKNFMKTIQSCLNAISGFFTYICGTRCAICIKQIHADNRTTTTLARDDISNSARGKFDLANDITHYIKDSTAFSHFTFGQTFNGNEYFICNNLIQLYKDNEYSNSTFYIPEVGKPRIDYYIKFGENHKFFKYLKWTLPYKSTMVFPIKSIENSCIIGFLCIDANHKDIFNFTYLTEFGIAFSRLFYLFITQHDFYVNMYKQHNIKA
jgi:hypothetical protein